MADILKEVDLLRPLDSSLTSEEHENDWPVFIMENALVTDKAGNLVSLFEAAADNLLSVSGELQKDKEQLRYYVSGRAKKTNYIEVNPVGRYAFGADGSGDNVSLWAAGRAGWFELQPALDYKQFFDEMASGVTAWYFLMDNPKLHKAPSKEVFAAYGKKKKVTPEVAEGTFVGHGKFLLGNMKKAEGRSWSQKPIYQYLKKHSGQASQSQPTPDRIDSKQPKRRGRKPRSFYENEVATPELSKEEANTKSLPAILDLKRVEADAAVLWKFIQRASEETARPRKLKMEILAKSLVNEFVFDSNEQATSYIRFQGTYLVKYMQERRRRKDWMNSPLYEDLQTHVIPPKTRSRVARIQLQVRDYRLADKIAVGGLEMYSSSDEEIATPYHTKSGLRPKSAGKKRKSYTAQDATPAPNSDDGANMGSPVAGKRKNMEDRSDQRKRRALSNQDSDDSSQRAQSADPVTEGDKSLPLRWKSEPSRSGDTPRIIRGVNLDPQPNSPGDIWQCSAPDCLKRIYGASGELGQELINEHIENHREAEFQQPQIDIAMQEMKKTNLPVANLIKRIREFAAAQELADTIAGASMTDSDTNEVKPIDRLFA
ncbi:hypothetical protein BT63DRAFT_430409 [Microthyrium microscopicum]|uniref:DNA (cytosine-5)-methyltransferase 1 replication foci domain-containing protein n=1 Tax=Microthyrium microscopicum TaxID=703497 RepID=A0A6A6TUS3_9PEZI|nr:hypothetical protein BT63DRAFT_430409 [Microthyrium microscopicum]